ncbi:alpha beta-hydrolase [Coniophora puteana RWD-64-598 SS2]|uniref:Alpha beta-hydrolase n=1 Tax=Coniophora puteana (strain RWD-64-598) TaxID=741705 RepID=A0A5M3MAE0_CONPW|nr:alpha beta-hydrolase [Coniophora puteana RWD-64-598 SS2]EIW75926.1 alpha beta-hydrolase [Coniophora puteana RWD-64-598 SS2]
MSKFLPSLGTFAKGTAATAAGLGTIGCGLLYYGQNYLIYPSAFPPGARLDVPVPTDYGLQYEDLDLVTSDGVTLRSYLLPQKKNLNNSHAVDVPHPINQTDEEFASTRPTVMMFHGNGGNHGHRIPLAKVFHVRMRCNVLMLSYRGYGHSDGSPSELGLCIDAQTALDYVLSHPYLSKTPIILYGQSIGGAVAIHLASKNPSKITALILENTFTNLPRLIPSTLPLLAPLSFLCHQKWDSASKVPLIPRSTPILMLSGVKDEVVPHVHMQELWEIVCRRQGTKRAEQDHIGETTVDGDKLGEGTKEEGASTDTKKEEESRSGTGTGEIGSGLSKFIEYEAGFHNDTCVQPGYWATVSEFVAAVGQAHEHASRL